MITHMTDVLIVSLIVGGISTSIMVVAMRFMFIAILSSGLFVLKAAAHFPCALKREPPQFQALSQAKYFRPRRHSSLKPERRIL